MEGQSPWLGTGLNRADKNALTWGFVLVRGLLLDFGVQIE